MRESDKGVDPECRRWAPCLGRATEHKPLAMDEAASATEDSATAEQPADDADACEERAKLTAAV